MNKFKLKTKKSLLSRETLKAELAPIRWELEGKVSNIVGTIIEASLPNSNISSIAEIETVDGTSKSYAEVVGFRNNQALLIPFNQITGIAPGCRVTKYKGKNFNKITINEDLLGKNYRPFST